MRIARGGLVGFILVMLVMGLRTPFGWTQPSSASWPEDAASSAATLPEGSSDEVDRLLGRYRMPPAIDKLGRGLSNVAGGWLEIPLNIQQRYVEHNTAASLCTGILYGLIKGAARTGVGVYETVTFFLPYPEHFAPILPTLPYFQRTTNRQPLLWE